MLRIALALALVSLAADRAYPCQEPLLVDRPLTIDGAQIPPGGGVVMATVSGFDGGDDQGGFLQLTAGKTNVEMARTYIAPALTVIVAKTQPNRTVDLVSGRGNKVLSVTQVDVQPKHAAPKLSKVHSTLGKTKPDPRQPWSPTSVYQVELAEAAPDDVLALVVHVGGNGIAWAAPQKGQTTYLFYAGGKQCSPGSGALAQGTKVTVAWLDRGGRLSLESRELVVTKTPDKKWP